MEAGKITAINLVNEISTEALAEYVNVIV